MRTIILASLIFPMFFLSCEKNNIEDIKLKKGNIVGYVKCREVIKNEISNDYILGFYIISDQGDSLCSFNIPDSIHKLNIDSLEAGNHYVDNNIRASFKFRKALETEIKHVECPPSSMMNPTFYSVENFPQVIIEEIYTFKSN